MKTPLVYLALLVLAAILTSLSCRDQAARMNAGFRLPEGDEARGREAFVSLQCQQCHTVAGMELPKPESPSAVQFELGGEVRKVKTYGELVTAIIQPQHIVSPEYLEKMIGKQDAASPMPSFNDTMTVTQLTDIVTFLHAHYQKAPPPGVKYPYYLP